MRFSTDTVTSTEPEQPVRDTVSAPYSYSVCQTILRLTKPTKRGEVAIYLDGRAIESIVPNDQSGRHRSRIRMMSGAEHLVIEEAEEIVRALFLEAPCGTVMP